MKVYQLIELLHQLPSDASIFVNTKSRNELNTEEIVGVELSKFKNYYLRQQCVIITSREWTTDAGPVEPNVYP